MNARNRWSRDAARAYADQPVDVVADLRRQYLAAARESRVPMMTAKQIEARLQGKAAVMPLPV